MTPQQVIEYFGSGYGMNRETGMSHVTLRNWIKWGYVPKKAQEFLEEFTEGLLVSGEPFKKDTAEQHKKKVEEVQDENSMNYVLKQLQIKAEHQIMLQRTLIQEIKKARALIPEDF